MKYISIDIETTGLNPRLNNIIEFAAVIEDSSNRISLNKLPSFQAYIEQNGDDYRGSAFALQMNQKILKILADKDYSKYNIIKEENLTSAFTKFLDENGFERDANNKYVINVAGKNVGNFDLNFLECVWYWTDSIHVRHRVIDPSILFCDWEHDETLPSLQICNQRAQFGSTEVSHNALDDALNVIMLLRTKYYINTII